MKTLFKIKNLTVFLIILFIFYLPNFTFPQSNNQIDSLENLLANSTIDTIRIKIRIELFERYFSKDTTKSERCLKEMLDEIESKNIKVPARLLFEIGKLYENFRNDYPNALKYYELAAIEAKKNNDPNFITYEGWLGYTLSKIGESEKAVEKLINVVEIAENENQLKFLPRTYLLLAFAFRDVNKFDKAEIYFNKTIEISNKIGDSSDIHNALHEIGNLYNIKSDYKKAVEFHMKALEIRERQNIIGQLVYSYHDISFDYLAMDSLEIALKYAEKAEKYALQVSEKWVLISIYSNIVDIYTKLKRFKEGEVHLQKMQMLAEELNMKSTYQVLYQSYYNFYKSQNQYEKALKYYELFIAYKDSISNEAIQKNISELDKKYETAKKDKEIMIIQERIKRQQVYILAAVFGFLIVIIFMLIIYRQYRQKKEAYQKLENQNLEILNQKEELKKLADELKELNATKDKLFSIIAHDLRSPFMGIQGFSDLLLNNINNLNSTEIKEYIGYIDASAKNTLDLLSKLLEWAKNQTGQISFNPINLKLEPVVNEILEVLYPSAKIKNIDINYSQSEDINVYADLNMLKTILRNLIQNAIKFTNSNGLVNISAVKKSDCVEINISDNGMGMNDYVKNNIFEIDKKKTSKGTDDEKGIGLGLILCKDFIEKHGGKICVESELNVGSKFIIAFPDKSQ